MAATQKWAYLTIDDGPTEDFKLKVDYLNSQGIQAIWFCMGKDLEAYPEKAIYAIRKGHIIGNHSYDHPYFSEIELAEAREQIVKTDGIIESIYFKAGIPRPVKTFRFPYLNIGSKDKYLESNWSNEHVMGIQSILRELGYVQPNFENIQYEWYKKAGFDKYLSVDCTYDTFDWCLQDGQELFGYHDLPTVLGRMDEHVPESGRGLHFEGSDEIVMMHAWIPMEAFQALIEKLLHIGIRFKLPREMNLDIRPIQKEEYQQVHSFQCEYLDDESFCDFVARIEANPDLYLAAFDEDQLVGVCYGHPSNKSASCIGLQGIAVNLDERKSYARKGIGSRMMGIFEQAVKKKGYFKIDVGAADDLKVEHFYMKNGFMPYELVAKGPQHHEYERVKVTDYESGKLTQNELRQKYQPKEVIFIFEKSI